MVKVSGIRCVGGGEGLVGVERNKGASGRKRGIGNVKGEEGDEGHDGEERVREEEKEVREEEEEGSVGGCVV